MRYYLLFLVAATVLNSTASGQSSSSRGKLTLLPGGFAKVKVEDLRYVAAYRVLANDYRTNATLEIAALRRANAAKDEEIKAILEREATKDMRIRAIAERNSQIEDDLTRCAKKRDALRTWATIGKGAVALAGIALSYHIYQRTRP